MTLCVVTIPNSSHEQPGHELKRIQNALEVLLGVKCHFSRSSGSNEFQNESSNIAASNDCSSSYSSAIKSKPPGAGQEISKVKQIQNHNRTLTLSINFETDLSPENISRAKKFVLTHLSSEPAYIISNCCLATQRDFDMVVQSASSIQLESSALLTFDRDTKEISIQGSESSVKYARTKIGQIIDSLAEQRVWSHSLTSDISSYGVQKEPMEISQRDMKQHEDVLLKLIGESKSGKTFPTSSLSSESAFDLKDLAVHQRKENTSVERFLQSTDGSAVSYNEDDRDEESFSSSDGEFENDDGGDSIFLDKRFSKQVETGLKLGYSEDNVKKALLKLGLDCPSNDLLSELIAISTAEPIPSKGAVDNQESDQTSTSIISTDGSLSYGSRGGSIQGSLSPNVSPSSFEVPKPIDPNDRSNLRHIIIDGSNVAMSHGKESFSCKGIKIAVDWFKARGHKYITAFVPKWRKESSRPDALITDQELLKELERDNVLVFTPARRVKGRRVVCYDDRFILKLAVETDGIVVSNDVYRDLVTEREAFRQVVDQRLLMYTFVGDRFMPPEDPLGRSGPTLDNFLRKVPIDPRPRPQDCPFGKKCTYGNKCRFYHPERGFGHQKLVSETLKEQADAKLQERANKIVQASNSEKEKGRRPKQMLTRTKSLVPGALLSSRQDLEFSMKSASRSEKPKLAHSTSLNLSSSSKSSDYLDSARRKFEEAELLSATKNLSLDEKSSMKMSHPSKEAQGFSQSAAESRRISTLSSDLSPHSSSPMLATDNTSWQGTPFLSGFVMSSSGIQQTGLMVETTTAPSPTPAKSKSRQASPSHLPLPKQSEPYVSGHLELARKLSDEGSDSNFFSEHASSKSASSTPRTASPVIPPATSSGQKRGKSKNSTSKSHNEEGKDQEPQLRPQLTALAAQSTQAGGPDTPNFLGCIPNLSVFNEQNQPSTTSQSSLGQTHETVSDEGKDPISSSHTAYSKAQPIQQSSLSQSSNIPQSQSEDFAISHSPSSQSVMSSGRRASECPMNPVEHKHMPLKAQSSVPSMVRQHAPASSRALNFPSGLSRQNSSSDPQVHMCAVQHANFSVSNATNSTPVSGHTIHNTSSPANVPQVHINNYMQAGALPSSNTYNTPGLSYQTGMYHNTQIGSRGEPQSVYENQLLSRRMQQQQMQMQQQQQTMQQSPPQTIHQHQQIMQQQHGHGIYMEQPLSSPGLSQYSPMGSRVNNNSFGSPCQSGMQLPSGPGLASYQYEQHLVSPQYSQVPQIFSNPEGIPGMQQMLMSPPSSNYASPDFPQYFRQPPPNFPPPTGPVMQNFSSQPPPQMFYSVPPSGPLSNAGYPSPTTYSHLGPSVPQVPTEDTPIPTTDPRHSLYAHLSTVFQEPVVRKVMNRHPHLLKFDDVVSKIMQHLHQAQP